MRVAVDAMGGDYAPGAIVEGAIEASRSYGIEVLLVGKPEAIEEEIFRLKRHGRLDGAKFQIIPADEVVEMDDDPLHAVRHKRNSSMAVALRTVKSGEADAFVSAGSTGAAYGIARAILGRVKGVTKPAIAVVMPNVRDQTVVIDAGANVDCSPKDLAEFAVMGSIYSELILGKSSPRVGLLNIGTEEIKGNDLVFGARPLLREAPINFIGDVEGRDVMAGTVDVVVCDGFIGNVILKFGEGMADLVVRLLKNELSTTLLSKIGAALIRRRFENLKAKLDYTEYGGAPLLGINGACIIAHGSSCPNAIKNAVRVASEYVERGINRQIERRLKG
ncbi:TPA: phosphate acyltransferase PlsX [Candidatus Poribacteria bacterium]|nr:phosphate acyltransferase PlsX [Candidatus Poribacteria bacterium]HEX30881.1 phosphate acyltransferase PlsX [Candidatus Poribacteria bacterium]